MNTIPPTQLWLGPSHHLQEKAIEYLQGIFCAQQGCLHCITCRHIQQKQHHGVIWLHPEKHYTLDEIAIIPSTISYALNRDEKIFFVIQKADFLTPTTANSLLKSLEEPPHGYHFILHAERLEALLPTIRSRSIVKMFATDTYTSSSVLFDFFTTTKAHLPSSFLSTLEQSKITERESIELLDALLHHWVMVFKNAVQNNDTQGMHTADHALSVLKGAYACPPMPGSSKIFWKNVYLQLKQ